MLSQLNTTTLLCFVFLLKPFTLAGFEPRSSVPEVDTLSIAPRRQGKNCSTYGLPGRRSMLEKGIIFFS
jgi:hypothetical protein